MCICSGLEHLFHTFAKFVTRKVQKNTVGRSQADPLSQGAAAAVLRAAVDVSSSANPRTHHPPVDHSHLTGARCSSPQKKPSASHGCQGGHRQTDRCALLRPHLQHLKPHPWRGCTLTSLSCIDAWQGTCSDQHNIRLRCASSYNLSRQ